ncbi:MAG: DUF2293 domain-containing protein [Candidatus Rokubacteria bacterium]|nr:DUF2293 domain-containing protein [Candidatus Rokubacteria bacterium]
MTAVTFPGSVPDVERSRGGPPPARDVVWISHRDGARCEGCGTEITKGTFVLVARESGIRCLECAGLADLLYLPAGDPALTRRALGLSSRSATVVKFSRTRKRHERQGVLVEEGALERARGECEKDQARREGARVRRRARDAVAEQDYVVRFAQKVRDLFPACPAEEAEAIAIRACQKYSSRVGRSRAAKALDETAINLAVRAHVRHRYSRYDELLVQGLEPFEARPLVAEEIERMLDRWREPAGDPGVR